MKKTLVFILSLIISLNALSVSAMAHPVLDPAAGGSISVILKSGDKALSGGSLSFIRVAEIKDSDGDLSFTLCPEFTASGISIADVFSAETAAALLSYAEENKLAGTDVEIKDSMALYTVPEAQLGLYLVSQKEACKGYEKISPFLIGVPKVSDEGYIYDVDASPKMAFPRPLPEEKPLPGGKLPQTGQLNWPIPLLALLGLGFFTAGWILSRKGRE